MKVVVFTRDDFSRELGSQTRTLSLLRALANSDASVTLATLKSLNSDQKRRLESKILDRRIGVVHHSAVGCKPRRLAFGKVLGILGSWRSWLFRVIRFIAGNLCPWYRTYFATPYAVSRPEALFAKELCRSVRPDAVILDYASLADLLCLSELKGCLRVIFTHEVSYLIAEDLKKGKSATPHLPWTRQREVRALSKADVLVASCEEDAEELVKLAPKAEVILCHLGIGPQRVTGSQVAGRCLFVGSHTAFTIECIILFLQDVWPQILTGYPHATLHIVGSVGPEVERYFVGRAMPAGVKIVGVVDALSSEYGAAEVCVAPITVPRGVKIKIMEAISYGRAVVTTPTGADGTSQIRGKAVFVVDNSREFADAVLNLLANPTLRKAAELSAEKFATENLLPSNAYGALIDRLGCAAPAGNGI